MTDDTTPKRRPTPASWKPGTSGNPRGRPRTALADVIRRRLDPEVLAAAVAKHLTDGDPRVVIAAATFLRDSAGWKAPEQHEIAAVTPEHVDEQRVLAELSTDALRELVAAHERVAARTLDAPGDPVPVAAAVVDAPCRK